MHPLVGVEVLFDGYNLRPNFHLDFVAFMIEFNKWRAISLASALLF